MIFTIVMVLNLFSELVGISSSSHWDSPLYHSIRTQCVGFQTVRNLFGGWRWFCQLYKPGKSVGEHHYSSEPTVGSVCSISTINNHEQVLGQFRKSQNSFH